MISALGDKILLLVILLAMSAFFSGSETAIISINKLRVMHLVEKKKKGAKILEKLKDNPHKTLTTILIGNNLVNVASSVLATSIAVDIFKNHALGIATGLMTLLLLVFGEITPKSLATTYRAKISLMVAKPIYVLSIVLMPLVWVFDKFAKLITKNSPDE